MKANNFIAFFTVCGFFIGFIFVVIKIPDPIEMVVYNLLITFFFYLVIHLAIMRFINVDNQSFKSYFNKADHEEVNERLVAELSSRERKMEGILSKLAAEKLKARREKKAKKPKKTGNVDELQAAA